ncbi:2-5 RNA ligase superfamily [uncultured virus]|nr:2-5 RNA ligase superfamily [uncultured virus]
MDTKSALTCLVPELDQIQDLRRRYDTAYNRWPPHFNIGAFPFLPYKDHETVAPLIQNFCSKYFPIEIVLAGVDNFKAGRKKPGTLFATVNDDTGLLKRLYSEICAFLKVKNEKEFHPHVTLGRFDDQSTMENVMKKISWKPINFVLTGLHWIVRDGDTSFTTRYFFPFGETSFERMYSSIVSKSNENSNEKSACDSEEAYTGTVSKFRDYLVYHLSELEQQTKPKPKIMNILVIDNSGSMEDATRESTRIIGEGMFNLPQDRIEMLPGTVIVFSEDAFILSSNVRSASDIRNLRFPRQGQTNITAGIEMALSCVLSNHSMLKDDNIHYIITFLSDGQHNFGPEISDNTISKMRARMNEIKIQLSIIVVGISSNDTRLGMKIKTGLETVTMNRLESVYYARSSSQMSSVLQQLNTGCVESLCGGVITNLSVTGGIFMETMASELTSFIHNGATTFLVKQTGSQQPELTINDNPIEAVVVEPNPDDIRQVIELLLPKMSQMKIAHGNSSIDRQIQNLEQFINISEEVFETLNAKNVPDHDQIGRNRIRPRDRLDMIKKVRTAKVQFQQERNKLKLLKAKVEDSSAKQAEFLTGINKKYGDKAILRADTINTTPQQILTRLIELRDKLGSALDRDRENKVSSEDHSLLSLNTPIEQIEEWIEAINDINGREFNDIYSLLVCFGFAAYPVKFEHNNAVQMDPFQTYCSDIEPCLIDTSSLMLAQQLNHRLLSPANEVMTDCIVLIQPSAPNSYSTVIRSPIYQYIASVTLCRDLYMYHPKMTFSMHAHALLAAITKYYKTKSSAYLDLSLRILYSIRKFWGPTLCKEGDNMNLFNHWWKEWNTITQSETDQCNHPVQLLLMLGACDISLDKDQTYVSPLINLLNEILARKSKIGLAKLCKSPDDSSKEIATKLARKLLDITPENSPKPNPDIMTEEPTLIAVRESCQHWADVDNNQFLEICNKLGFPADSVHDYVNSTLLPYLQTFHFGLSLQKLLLDKNLSWDQLIDQIDTEGKIPEKLIEELTPELMEIDNQTIYQYLDLDDKHSQQVSETMFLQSLLCHDSYSRHDINMKNILDSVTLQDIIRDLRMSCYFDACKVKKQQWLQIIGNVTFEQAFNGDETVFERLIGYHTHGLTHDQFWAMARAAKDNPVKKEIFLRKSNGSVLGCFMKIK